MVVASAEDHWLQVGAIEKARSIVALAGGSTADRILEVGAGSGAILRELDRLKFGRQYWACEPSQKLYEQLMRTNIERLVEAHPTTLEDSPMVDNHFDLVVLSHVLEHVVAPGQLLARCLALAPRVVLEVPLEGSVVARFRATLIRRRRWPNAAGHIHFFSKRSTHELVSHAGGQVISGRAYFPLAAYQHQANDPVRRAIVRVARISPPLGRLYHAHLALLIVPRHVDISDAHDSFYNPAGAPTV